MGRSRSNEGLPHFSHDQGHTTTPWSRRYWLYLSILFFVGWFLWPQPSVPDGDTIRLNWSRYAYSLYATDGATLCHSVLVFDALERLGSKADRVLFYPKHWDTVISDSKDRDSQLLVMARDRYRVKLHPISLLHAEGRTTDASWTRTGDKSVTKLMAFSLEYYDRVIALDSDITLQASLDELFLLPSTPIAMPRAYWYEAKPKPLTSLLMVIEPNQAEFVRFQTAISDGGDTGLVRAHLLDMELINNRFQDSAMVLPHRPYALLSGELRRHNHSAYLGNTLEAWNVNKVMKEAKLVHFSDWPLPKPWIMWPAEGLAEVQPDCGGQHETTCEERKLWKGLYDDFRQRRRDVCKLLSVPAPVWKPLQSRLSSVHLTSTISTIPMGTVVPG